MKVLFPIYFEKKLFSRELFGPMYLSSVLKNAGHQVEFSSVSRKNLQNKMDTFSPDVVAFSSITGHFKTLLKINNALKDEYSFFSVFGGPHATYEPGIVNHPGIDAVCRGEGEEAFVDFLDRFQNNKQFEKTPNFWVKRNQDIFRNDIRPMIENMDDLPFPDRDLYYRTFGEVGLNPVKSFMNGRGCPYKCSYCQNSNLMRLYRKVGNKVRIRSVENTLEEIERVRQDFGLQLVRFVSDIFYTNIHWLEEFSEKYPKRIGLPFFCLLAPPLVNEKSVRLLKRAGVLTVAVGIESADEATRKTLLNRMISDECVHKALHLLQEARINVMSYNIIGIPGSPIANDFKLAELNSSYKVAYAYTTIMTPFPDTQLLEYAQKNNLIPKGGIQLEGTFPDEPPMMIPDRKRIARLQKLLAIASRFKTVRIMLPLLTRLPLGIVYLIFYQIFRAYSFQQKITPFRPSLKFTAIIASEIFLGFRNNDPWVMRDPKIPK